eukprot:TRINITY_DN2070_c0_g1_i1.p1 TRINITY_DN2070_c0_g1~~TRINITY_DN2070_c0_g1_i1.p1  ORF type:complete len:197 (-),score=52.25 TRINITY_DN2070_c0_g1_i1:595-1185(-)
MQSSELNLDREKKKGKETSGFIPFSEIPELNPSQQSSSVSAGFIIDNDNNDDINLLVKSNQISDEKKEKEKEQSNRPRRKKKAPGLEVITKQILELMQLRGKLSFAEMNDLGLDYRRLYDILNVLQTTPLISKEGKKRDRKKPFIYGDGTPMPEAVDLSELLPNIEKEQELIIETMQSINTLQQNILAKYQQSLNQ